LLKQIFYYNSCILIYVRFNNMNQFISSIFNQIIEDFPEWKDYSCIQENTNNEEYICFTIPCPKQANVKEPLLIIVDNFEITVSFADFHSHFNSWKDNDINDNDTANYFIRNILNEEIVIYSCWNQNKWVGSSYIDVQNNLEDVKPIYESDLIKYRSWNGTHNRELQTINLNKH
jgi:hypothetical protein